MAQPIAVDPPSTDTPPQSQAADRQSTNPAHADIGAITNPYRLQVWSSNVAQAISAAGGWLFDRRMAGWAVTVVAPDAAAARHGSALRTLGVTATTRDQLPDPHLFSPFGIAVLADLYRDDADMRSLIDQHDQHCARVGELWIVGGIREAGATTTAQLIPAPHLLSLAARAFKRAALAAIHGDMAPDIATEPLCRVSLDGSQGMAQVPSGPLHARDVLRS